MPIPFYIKNLGAISQEDNIVYDSKINITGYRKDQNDAIFFQDFYIIKLIVYFLNYTI